MPHNPGRCIPPSQLLSSAYSAANGLPLTGLQALYEDQAGRLWIGSSGGLCSFKDGKFSPAIPNLNVWAILSTAYGKADDMLNSDCNGGRQPSGIKTADGRLWFATLGGVAVVDPAGVTQNPLPPPVQIEEVKIDNATATAGDKVQIQPGQSNLEIHYTGLSFIKPEQLRFRYKLIGQDPDWIEADARRVANYSYLRPGAYTFQVLAASALKTTAAASTRRRSPAANAGWDWPASPNARRCWGAKWCLIRRLDAGPL